MHVCVCVCLSVYVVYIHPVVNLLFTTHMVHGHVSTLSEIASFGSKIYEVFHLRFDVPNS